MAEQRVNEEEDEYGAQASAAPFPSRRAGQQSAEHVVHRDGFDTVTGSTVPVPFRIQIAASTPLCCGMCSPSRGMRNREMDTPGHEPGRTPEEARRWPYFTSATMYLLSFQNAAGSLIRR